MSVPKKQNLFESTTLRLTGWYMVIVMTLSILFSVILYAVASSEINRAFEPRRLGERGLFLGEGMMAVRDDFISESNSRLGVSLVLFNLTVLLGGSALSYFLARRTLYPIEVAHDAQARFASDAAHELRTPLAVMRTESEVVLRSKKASSAELRQTLKSNLEEVSRLQQLTDRLLLLAVNQELVLNEVNAKDAAMEAVTRVALLVDQKKIEIDNQVQQVKVLASHDSLVDVLGILLDNAIKYSPSGSRITLVGEIVKNNLLISVVDEGVGVPPEEQVKIFERFYRADRSRSKENVEGHGLGLSLAKQLCDDMKANLVVKSDGCKGSTFTISLPLAKA